ncbi:hypothetical protein HDU86_007519 [Geranomyces michiganensis]|nr:hypothetical protein HDU86_007519 [Geranomyces michiganensis]
MATASSIFKIRAIADFLAPKAATTDNNGSATTTLLSFRQSQAFYVLSTDKRKGLYFVSTQYATPFARTAVSGLVPMSHFEQVDLLSKDNAGKAAGGSSVRAAGASSRAAGTFRAEGTCSSCAAGASTRAGGTCSSCAVGASAAAAGTSCAAAAAAAAEPLPAAARPNLTKRLYSYLHSNVRRHSEGALLAPPELRPGEEEHDQRRRAGTIPRNVTPAQRSTPTTTTTTTPAAASLRRSPTSMLIHNTPTAAAAAAVLDPAARVTDIQVIRVTMSTTHPPSYAIRVTRYNAPTTIIERTYDDFSTLANRLLQTFSNDDNKVIATRSLPALPPPPPFLSSSSQQPTAAAAATTAAQQLLRRLDTYVRHLRHGTPASVGDCAAVCEFLAPRNAHEAAAATEHEQHEQQQQQQRPRKDSGFATTTTTTAAAAAVDGMAVDMQSKLCIMSPRPGRGDRAGDESGEFDFAEDFYQAYV